MQSGAGHDAMIVGRQIPAAMLFVPSLGGRSHHISEDTDEADIRRGLESTRGRRNRSFTSRARRWWSALRGTGETETMRMIGVDVGGTFTDIVYCDMSSATSRSTRCRRRPTILRALSCKASPKSAPRTAYRPTRSTIVLHGTTTATNAVLEHKGARTGMVTNHGLSRHRPYRPASARRALLDPPGVALAKPAARPAPLSQGGEGPSRSPRGEELEPLDEADVIAAARALKEDGVEAVAVCFLFSYLNPAHEERAKQICRASCPASSSRPLHPSLRSSANSSASPRRRSALSSGRRCAPTSASSTPRCGTPACGPICASWRPTAGRHSGDGRKRSR